MCLRLQFSYTAILWTPRLVVEIFYKIYVRWWYSYTTPFTIKYAYVTMVGGLLQLCRSYMMTEDVGRMKMGAMWWDIGGLPTAGCDFAQEDTTSTMNTPNGSCSRRNNIYYCLLFGGDITWCGVRFLYSVTMGWNGDRCGSCNAWFDKVMCRKCMQIFMNLSCYFRKYYKSWKCNWNILKIIALWSYKLLLRC